MRNHAPSRSGCGAVNERLEPERRQMLGAVVLSASPIIARSRPRRPVVRVLDARPDGRRAGRHAPRRGSRRIRDDGHEPSRARRAPCRWFCGDLREAPAGTPRARSGEHEPLDFADRVAPRWTHDDGVAPLSKESQPSPLAAAAVRSRSGDAAGAGAAPPPLPEEPLLTLDAALSLALDNNRQVKISALEAQKTEHQVNVVAQQATAAVPRRRAGRLAAAALRLHLPGGLLRHLPGDGADPVDRRQDPHPGAVHEPSSRPRSISRCRSSTSSTSA